MTLIACSVASTSLLGARRRTAFGEVPRVNPAAAALPLLPFLGMCFCGAGCLCCPGLQIASRPDKQGIMHRMREMYGFIKEAKAGVCDDQQDLQTALMLPSCAAKTVA